MADFFPIARPKYRITTVDDAKTGILGNAAEGRPGLIALQFNPAVSWTGEIAILGRVYGKVAHDDSLGFTPIPFKRILINGVSVPVDPQTGYPWGAELITGPSLIHIPANGLSVGVLVSCTAGFGDLYSWNLVGSGAV